MSAELLASKITVQEEEPELPTIEGVPTAIAAMEGVTEMGPVGVATEVTSFAQWRRIFGRDVDGGLAASAVRGFYGNAGDGKVLYFTRVVHYTDVSDSSTKTSTAATLDLNTGATAPSAGTVIGTVVGPYEFQPGGTLIFNIDGGGDDTATFDAAAASVTAGNAPTYNLTDGWTLTLKINGGSLQTITFHTANFVDITAATTAEVNAVINAQLNGGFADDDGGSPRITSDRKGTGSHVEVTGGLANGAFGFSTAVQNGTGDVADIEHVTVAEIKALVEADVTGVTVTNDGGKPRFTSNTTGGGSSVLITAASTLDDELGIDNATHTGGTGAAAPTLTVDAKYDGEYGNDITILITDATSGAAAEFNLAVLLDGVIVERFPNLTMDDDAARYAETIINDEDSGSRYIQVTDLDVDPSTPANERPANSLGSTPVPYGPLTGGDDGLVGLDDNDFIGDPAGRTGLRSFDLKLDKTLLSVPDRATAAVHSAMLAYAEITCGGRVFTVLDPPADLDHEDMIEYVETTASLLELSEFGAIYWPRLKVLNPNKAVYGNSDSIVVPVSGHVLGMYARTDGARVGGVYDPPGGVDKGKLFNVTGFENDTVNDEAVRDRLYPKLINPIARHNGQPIAVDGVRCLKSTGNFPTIGERRGVIFIESSLQDGLEFARLKNNDESLREEVSRTCDDFLGKQMKVGAFASKVKEQAYFVDVGTSINPVSEQLARKLNVRIGLATQTPAEFLVLSFSKNTRALQEAQQQTT